MRFFIFSINPSHFHTISSLFQFISIQILSCLQPSFPKWIGSALAQSRPFPMDLHHSWGVPFAVGKYVLFSTQSDKKSVNLGTLPVFDFVTKTAWKKAETGCIEMYKGFQSEGQMGREQMSTKWGHILSGVAFEFNCIIGKTHILSERCTLYIYYYIILCYIILFYIILYYFILYYIILYDIIWYDIILFYIILYYYILYYRLYVILYILWYILYFNIT